MRPKVVLGLSGGVDSAVAARLLLETYEVAGLYISVGPEGAAGEADARAVAEKLGLSFQSVDVSRTFEEAVKAPFAADYLAGRTPLPCARCNRLVKFPALLEQAARLGADWVATGHYARVERAGDQVRLLKGRPANDQSYMLARLSREQLQRVIFPLGDYEKTGVRALAKQFGLPVAEKKDSMELCFVPEDDYAAWLERRGAVPPPGDFVSPDGTVLGRHRGVHRYTLGQGKGLGVSGPHRYYVSGLDAASGRITLSDGSDLGRTEMFCTRPNWLSVEELTGPLEVTARFRHARSETPCTLFPWEGGMRVEAHSPVRAPTPGQLAVFYHGDVVVGSAWLE